MSKLKTFRGFVRDIKKIYEKHEQIKDYGFGFIEDVTFDTRFIKRGRFGRLCQTIAINLTGIGIGLGEDTGLLITEGNHMEAIGSGLVMIVEGGNVKYTNIVDIENGEPISIENLTVHVLSKGHNYILSERRMV